MKITPLEIRQKTFEKKLRGYDKEEVEAFLFSLSQEWEQTQDELKEIKTQYVNAEKEIKQLREVENSLFKTLKTAEDTGANLIDQANKTAELHMRETQMNADALLNEAKSRARATIEDAEMKARNILDNMEVELRHLKQDYKNLENLKDAVIAELRNLSGDILTRISKFDTSTRPEIQTSSTKEEKTESVEQEPPQAAHDTPEPANISGASESEPKNTEVNPPEEAHYGFREEQFDDTVTGEDSGHDEEETQEKFEEDNEPGVNIDESDDEDVSFFDSIK